MMFLVIVSCLAAMASAAPQGISDLSDPSSNFHLSSSDIETLANIYPAPESIGVVMNSFHIDFEANVWTVEVKDGQYIMSLPLNGYKKRDIEVLATRGLLIVRGVHMSENRIEKSQISLMVLPRTLDPAGQWTYDEEFIRVMFLLPTKNAQQEISWIDAGNDRTAVKVFTKDA